MAQFVLNGSGRIALGVIRAWQSGYAKELSLAGINSLDPLDQTVRLLRRDTVHGDFAGTVDAKNGHLVIDGREIPYTQSEAPTWPEGALVLDCTGAFLKEKRAWQHLEWGASKVLLSAPSKDAERTIVFGVNDTDLEGDEQVVSNASCTTNCWAPLVKVLHAAFDIQSGWCTTVHAATAGNNTVDTRGKNPYMERSILDDFIPTSTGAAKAIFEVMQKLPLAASAIRGPVACGSMVDFIFNVAEPVTATRVNEVLAVAGNDELFGVLEIDENYPTTRLNIGNSTSCVVDPHQTHVIGETMVRVLAHYDNETGYSHRMLDVATLMVATA